MSTSDYAAETSGDQAPIQQMFEQSVVTGSARFWAAHFTEASARARVQAALCFAYTMDALTTVHAEVIAEKSVWWHEELTNPNPDAVRHPTTRALLRASGDQPRQTEATSEAIRHALHEHLHGALMTQQRAVLSQDDEWLYYLRLRLGSLHTLLGLASGLDAERATTAGNWSARVMALSAERTADRLEELRLLAPPNKPTNAAPDTQRDAFETLIAKAPPLCPASAVLIALERRWWRQSTDEASPTLTSLPVGLRGMLAGWRAARSARDSVNR